MTIQEAITKLDMLKPNGIDYPVKIDWLSRLDQNIKIDIIDTHSIVGVPERITSFEKYDTSTPMDTELIIPSPYDDCYIYYMSAQIDWILDESDTYNNDIQRYNELASAFKNYWNKYHMPIPVTKIKFFGKKNSTDAFDSAMNQALVGDANDNS